MQCCCYKEEEGEEEEEDMIFDKTSQWLCAMKLRVKINNTLFCTPDCLIFLCMTTSQYYECSTIKFIHAWFITYLVDCYRDFSYYLS